MKRKVLLVDDHVAVRQGLQEILSGEIPELEFGFADGFNGAVEIVSSEAFHLAILDLNLSDGHSGLDLVRLVKEVQPRAAILIYSMHSEEQFGLRALKAGASGYLSKASEARELVVAVRALLAGDRYISHGLTRAMADALQQENPGAPHESLSDREYQIFCRLASGCTNGQIAEELRLSPKTVSTYRARVLEKLALNSTAELIRYAIERGLC